MFLVISLVVLLVVIFFAMLLVFRKVMTQNLTQATKHIEELSREYSKKEEEINRELEEARKKAEEIVNKANLEAQELKAQLIKEAETEKEKILNSARAQNNEIIQQAEKTRQKLILEIEERIENEAVKKACDLIDEVLPEEFKKSVHIYWIKELLNSGFLNLENLRIPEDIKEIKVISAFKLEEDLFKLLLIKLKDILKKDIVIKEEIDPKLVAGIVIVIGSLILDGSLKNKIESYAKKR